MQLKPILLAILALTAGHITYADQSFDYSANLKDGFSLSGYGSSIALEGRIQYDFVNFEGFSAASQTKAFDNSNDSFVRRGNLGLSGVVHEVLPYEARVAYDRKTHDFSFDRAWVGFTGLENIGVYAGRFKYNWGLEGATSSSWTTSNERPIMYDLTTGRDDLDYGYQITSSGLNHSLAVALAKPYFDRDEENPNKNFGYYAKFTFAPIIKPNEVLHLGLNYHDANPDNNDTKIATRLETRSDQDDKLRFAEVNNTYQDREAVAELAYQKNNLRLQGEYFYREVKGKDIGKKKTELQNVRLQGGYIQASYLWNASRKYNVAEGKWGKPTQFNTFEPFLRYEYSQIEPNEAASKKEMNNNVDGIRAINREDKYKINSYVAGINYFMNENIRFTLSYIYSELGNVDTSRNINGIKVKDNNQTVVGRIQFVF
ncbi:hypothetical protein F4V57_01870 [Acinetobacter qingfengensis]|uniref:Porin n=1 Tax=Acinetobacter qingfengensis TaxID=1262585 RepID=A0A1E7R8X2_9GAMM|nr:porin [Acinetobacter qingfengensis]KAA8735563.1 hypothetical protein F4V57_01870 [Acinetobacter qingfengensis]OEY95789.1 hypothetical protein BJI46_02370 [Acinetobacter qingfengensis]